MMTAGYGAAVADDDLTQEAVAGGPLPTTELAPPTESAGPLAYSDHTTSMPVVEYRAPRFRPVWIIALVLAVAAAVAGGAFFLGRTTGPQESAATAPVQASAPAQPPAAPPVAAPAPVAPASPPPAPTTVTVTAAPAPPVVTPESLPPDAQFTQMLARDGVSNRHPSGSIATAKNVCLSIENGSNADDFALSMNAAGMPYREAVAFVRDAVAVYCPGVG